MSFARFMSSGAGRLICIVAGIALMVAWLLSAQGIPAIILIVVGAVVSGIAVFLTGLLLAQGVTAIILIVVGTVPLLAGLFRVGVRAAVRRAFPGQERDGAIVGSP